MTQALRPEGACGGVEWQVGIFGPHPPEFRQRAVELVRLGREKRVLTMEIEILKRVAAYFARENVLPKLGSGSSRSSPPTTSPWR
jgi:hypothetical protein